jgi:hypothetical protein
MAADDRLARLRADAHHRVPDAPRLDELIEDIGRQRLAAYYVYSALLAGVIGGDGLARGNWPLELAEPMRRLGLARFAPRTGPGLDAQLTPAEQATQRSPDRQFRFAQLLVNLINQGAFGPLCGDADRVRLAGRDDGHRLDLELIKGWRVVGACPVKDHWELVAEYLAGMPPDGPLANAGSTRGSPGTMVRRLKEKAIAEAASVGVTLAVHIHPLGAVAGLGTELIRARIQAGREQADEFRHLSQELRTLRAQADGELGEHHRCHAWRERSIENE